MKFEQVKGENKGDIILYGLSTCVWCKKTKNLLDKIGCEYKYVYVDELDENDKEKVKSEIKKFNPRFSFPTLIINNKNCIVGYKEDEIKEALHK
jgi:glutaredoxin